MRKLFSIRSLLFAVFLLVSSAASFAQIGIGISVGFAPPELPIYEQPLCPGDGYIWTPGFWSYDDNEGDYYWVPGTWIEAPQVGYLWTPPYWGYEGGYRFHEGYWGPEVGFYGGISYGFGYFGNGYEGGRWDRDHFYYNRSVNNVDVNVVHNVYNTTVINNNTNINRVSYNGPGGVTARATPQQEAALQKPHIAPVAAQQQHIQTARTNPELRASTNHGAPPIAATAKPAAFSGPGVVAGRNAGKPYTPPANRAANTGNANNANANNPNRPANNNTANPSGGGNSGGGNANRPPAANSNPNNGGGNANRPPTANSNNSSNPNNSSNANRPNSYSHVKELPPVDRPPAPNTGNPKLDQKYQQQQQQVLAKQDQQRQQLATKQEADHQRLAQQNANQQRQQQVEQRHQQQTQQLQQQHTQQIQKMQQKQQPPPQRQAPPPQQQQQKPNQQKY
jgi:WXXGXW repeat (2 copies)